MEKKSHETYETPLTTRTRVSLESGICASSKEQVVDADDNTSVDIEEQTDGGSFELPEWN